MPTLPKLDQKKWRGFSLRVMIVAFLIYFMNAAFAGNLNNIYNTYFPDLYGWSRSAIALPATIASFIKIPTAFFFATALMRWSVKKILPGSIAMVGIGQILISLSGQYYAFFAGIMISYLACQLMELAVFALCANWFMDTRGRVLGFVTIGAPLSTAITVNVITRIILTFQEVGVGISRVHLVLGIVIILVGAITYPLIYTRPEDVGLQPDGVDRSQLKLEEVKAKSASTWTLKRLFRNKEAWMLMLGFGGLRLVLGGFMGVFVPRMVECGLSMEEAITFLSAGAIIGMPLSYLWGWIDDKIGTRTASVALAIGYVIMCVSMILAGGGNRVFLVIAVICQGSAVGGCPNLHPSLTTRVYGRDDMMSCHRYLSVVQGLIAAPAASLFALAFDLSGSYVNAFLVGAVVAAISVVCLFFCSRSEDAEYIAINGTNKIR